ncbi:hypothetical protein IJ541_09645 [bacterium]|nr:hypothetical protein [bacterium]
MFEFNATFLVAMASFVVFIMIMNTIFYEPILNIIRKRENYINSNYEDAKSFENSARDYNEVRDEKIAQTQEICRKDFKSELQKVQSCASEKVALAKNASKLEIQTEKEKLNTDECKLNEVLQTTVVKELADSIKDKIMSNVKG